MRWTAVSLFAKTARGLMARYMIDYRIDRPEGLKDFTTEGYSFRFDLSKDGDWVFTRPQPQPEPVSAKKV
jgi:cytoplasmic iron level regulating protein YaaA (DUF328/UPF0246 family)